jgi:hypothetical protein
MIGGPFGHISFTTSRYTKNVAVRAKVLAGSMAGDAKRLSVVAIQLCA